MTPLHRYLIRWMPDGLATVAMVVIYAGVLFGLALTVGYDHRDPILYLDVR